MSLYSLRLSLGTPLLQATKNAQVGDDMAAIKWLLLQGADPSCRVGLNGQTALCVATIRNDLDLVNLLLKYGARVNQTGSSRTPLYEAADRGYLPIVERLVLAGAEINTPVEEGATAGLRFLQQIFEFFFDFFFRG